MLCSKLPWIKVFRLKSFLYKLGARNLGFGGWGLGFRVQDLGFKGKGLPQGRGEAALLHDPLRVAHPSHHGARRVAPSVGFGVWGVRVVFLVLGLGVCVLGFEFWGKGVTCGF